MINKIISRMLGLVLLAIVSFTTYNISYANTGLGDEKQQAITHFNKVVKEEEKNGRQASMPGINSTGQVNTFISGDIKIVFNKTKNNLNDSLSITRGKKKRKIGLPYNSTNKKHQHELESVYHEKFVRIMQFDPINNYLSIGVSNYDGLTIYILDIKTGKKLTQIGTYGACKLMGARNKRTMILCLGAYQINSNLGKKFEFLNQGYENLAVIELGKNIYIKSMDVSDYRTIIFVYDKKTLQLIDSFHP